MWRYAANSTRPGSGNARSHRPFRVEALAITIAGNSFRFRLAESFSAMLEAGALTMRVRRSATEAWRKTLTTGSHVQCSNVATPTTGRIKCGKWLILRWSDGLTHT